MTVSHFYFRIAPRVNSVNMKQNTKKTLKFYLKHVKRFKWITAILMVCLVAAVSASMISPFFYKKIFDLLASEGDKLAIASTLIIVLFQILGVELAEWVFWRVFHFLNIHFESTIMKNLQNECFEYLHQHSYNFFSNNFAGGLVKKVGRFVRSFEGITDKLFFEFIPLIIRCIIALTVLFFVHPILGVSLGIWIAIFITANYFLSMYKWKFDIARSEADTKVTATLADSIANSVNVKLFSALPHEQENFGEVTEKWRKTTKRSWNVDTKIEAFQALLMVALNFMVLYFGIKLWSQDILTIGDFVLIQAYLMQLFHNLWNFGRVIRNFYQDLADAEEMTEILNTPHEISDPKNAKILNVTRGKVEFKNVDFSYEKGRPIINNLSFSVKPGEKIALIGPSGGGKSTTIKLLLRLFDIDRGQILIDEQNVAEVTQNSLRAQIALVPQDPILFHRTLLENIRYGRRDASDEEVIAVSKLAHCHEFIEKLPNKYQTFVGERGIKLSGGERQRVAIARAILSNTRILILDEATSQLDSESEKLIQDALENLMKNKTTFIIAHRLSTIMKMDRVFVLQDGEIVESGTHASLINEKTGLYKKLWDLQVGGYLEYNDGKF